MQHSTKDPRSYNRNDELLSNRRAGYLSAFEPMPAGLNSDLLYACINYSIMGILINRVLTLGS